MPALRRTHTPVRFVLVWFALSIGVAIASLLVKPQAKELICSGSVKLLLKTDAGTMELSGHTLDCPLCASTSAPPPAAGASAAQTRPPDQVPKSFLATRTASLTAASLPARGPPSFS